MGTIHSPHLAGRALNKSSIRHVTPNEPIDLLNVAFENPRKIAVKVDGNIGGLPKREKKQKLREPLDYATVKVSYDVPDRLTGLQELEELRRLRPNRKWNFLEINVPFEVSLFCLLRRGSLSVVGVAKCPADSGGYHVPFPDGYGHGT